MRGVAWMLGVLAALCVAATVTMAVVRAVRPPSAGAVLWHRQPASQVVAYRDAHGRVLAFLTAPVEYGAGACAADPTMSRAFAGTVPSDGGPSAIARRWVDAISLDVVTGRRLVGGPLVVSGARVDAEVPVPAGPCNPPTEHLTVVGGASRTVVLVRDEGVPGALASPAAEAELRALSQTAG